MIHYLDANPFETDENQFLINRSCKSCLNGGIDSTKTNNSKKYMIWHYWFFNHGFKLQHSVCNGCHDLIMPSDNKSDTAVVTIKNVDYRFIIQNISKSEAIYQRISCLKIVAIYKKYISKKSILKIESKTIILTTQSKQKKKKIEANKNLIDYKSYKVLTIYFPRYFHSKSIKILSLRYHELMKKIKEYEGKKYLMVNDCKLDKVLDKIRKTIGIVKPDDTLNETDDKLPDYITLKNVVILITCVMKDDDKFYPQIF